MDFNPQPDIPIPFTHSQYKPRAEKYIHAAQEFQEQAFQTLRNDRFQDNHDNNPRSHSAEPVWAAGTFGKKDGYYFNNKNLPKSNVRDNTHVHFEGTGNFKHRVEDNSKISSGLKSDLKDIHNFVKTEAKFMDWDNIKKSGKKSNLKVVTKPFIVPNSGTRRERSPKTEPVGYCKSPRREIKQTADVRFYGDHREPRESEMRSPRNDNKHEISRSSKTPVEHDNKERERETREIRLSHFNENNHEEEARQHRKLEREIESLTRKNKLKDKRIEELEKQVDDLSSNVHIERTRLIGYLDISKKEFLENDIYIITLRNTLHALFENNSKIINFSKLSDRGNLFLELGQEIEKNQTLWAKIHSEMDKMAEHVRVSEDRTRKLWEAETVQNNRIVNNFMLNKQGSIDVNTGVKNAESFEILKLKEDLNVYIDALEMEENTVKRLNAQVGEMEELITKYLRSENGQLNSGLKNTARKLIELQSRLEQTNSEKEEVERRLMILTRENDVLQNEVRTLEKEKEERSTYERELRETKGEYRKLESKNEILSEINIKNEGIITSLRSLIDDLTANKQQQQIKQTFVEKTPLVYEKKSEQSLPAVPQETFYEPVSYKLKQTQQYLETKLTPNLNPEPMSYKSPPFYTPVEGLADRKLSATSNNVYDPHVEALLGQLNTTYDDPNFRNQNQSYSRDTSGESRLRYVDPPSLDKPSSFLNAHTRIAESHPVSAQFSQDQIPLDPKSNKMEPYTVDLSTFGLQGGNSYKYSS